MSQTIKLYMKNNKSNNKNKKLNEIITYTLKKQNIPIKTNDNYKSF